MNQTYIAIDEVLTQHDLFIIIIIIKSSKCLFKLFRKQSPSDHFLMITLMIFNLVTSAVFIAFFISRIFWNIILPNNLLNDLPIN